MKTEEQCAAEEEQPLKDALGIRRFLKGVDEPAWVEVLNASYKEYESWWKGITVEEMLEQEKAPRFDFQGRFVAELDDKPVGVIHALVDKSSKEKTGFINDVCVIPAFRGRGIEEKLLEMATNEFKKRGVNLIRAWTGIKRSDCRQLFEKQGFKFAYRTIDMEIKLTDIPSNIEENTNVTFRSLRRELNKDVESLNWLTNECFRENPLHRERTVEETRQFLLNNPDLTEQNTFFAVLDGKTIGYINVGINERYNVEHDVKSGQVSGIGVLKAYRRRGIGTQLILQGLETLKAKGMTKAMLDTEDTNPTKAMTLYKKIGFRILQEYVTYEKHLE